MYISLRLTMRAKRLAGYVPCRQLAPCVLFQKTRIPRMIGAGGVAGFDISQSRLYVRLSTILSPPNDSKY